MMTLTLDGAWKARQVGRDLTVDGTVPGCIHTDLLAAGRIEDPFFRTQEFDAYWVAESDWEYSRRFTVTDTFLAADQVKLVCHGLDTLARISLNGTEIGCTDNMFRTWEFDVQDALEPGPNTIRVRFDSALNYTIRKERERHLPGASRDEKVGYHGYIRKEQCNFGWDWGIRTVTCGIWRSMILLSYSTARLADVHVRQHHRSRRQVDLSVDVTVESVSDTDLTALVRVSRESSLIARDSISVASGTATAEITISNAERWWPNTMGRQPLYDVEVELQGEDGKRLDLWKRRIGLRTLSLDRHNDEWGECFRFLINGVPFFAKGANWIPADAYNNRVTPERYRDLVAAAAHANMNMLRVWGGGLYEEDVFYDLCDEYGICVWQDFMFACYAYPFWSDKFVANVREEAIDNVKRLRHHPSIALWCGNNELEQGTVGPEWTDKTMSWEDYGKVFDVLLPRIVDKYDGQTDYWPGSPHSPCGDRAYHRNPKCGDAHLWDVWHRRRPFEWYRTCDHRFCSEFGFQSFPEPRTTYGYTAAGDFNVTSYVMEHHQRSGIGNSTIMHYMLDWFRLPCGFEETLWTSQILQGMAIKYAVEHWRRSMPRCMGVLYWQFNDTWPVASWSSIDYHHRWKALHYMAKRFFAPLLLSGLEDRQSGQIEVHVTNDGSVPRDLTLRWTVTDAKGEELDSGEKIVKCGPNRDSRVHTLRTKKLLDSQSERDLLIWLEAYEDRRLVAGNLVTFARPKHLSLEMDPFLRAEVRRGPNKSLDVTLESKAVALWSWIEFENSDFRADDNFVHVRPGAPVTLRITPDAGMTLVEARKRIRARSLVDLSRES